MAWRSKISASTLCVNITDGGNLPFGSNTPACGKSTSRRSGRVASSSRITALPAAERSVATATGNASNSAAMRAGA